MAAPAPRAPYGFRVSLDALSRLLRLVKEASPPPEAEI